MNFLLDSKLVTLVSIIFWTTPIALAINLALIRNKPNLVKKRVAYSYLTLWAIAFAFYVLLFLTSS